MASVILNQTSAAVYEGESVALTVAVSPTNAKDKTIAWTSSNSSVATVNSRGWVTGVRTGTATIRATAANGTSASCTVTVSAKPEYVIDVASVSLNETEADIKVGENVSLLASVSPVNATNKTVTWTSYDEEVATVNGGWVTGVKAGTTIITATSVNGKSASCTVTVTGEAGGSGEGGEPAVVEVSSVTLNKSTASLYVGGSETLTASVAPSDATDKTVIWSSNATGVATVSGGKVTAKAAGTAIITATAKNGKKASCTVTVSNKPEETVAVSSVTLNKTTTSLYVGGSETLTASVAPSDATDKTVIWSSNATGVATVSGGKVTAVAAGTATITATASNGQKASCTVTVSKKPEENIAVSSVSLNKQTTSIYEGESETLTATVLPSNATNKTLTWTSDNTAVAMVGSSGRVTAIKAGSAKITAKSVNGKTASCTVTVVAKQTDSIFEVPYLSTYYFEPRLTANDNVQIPVYITDYEQSDFLKDETDKKLDLIYEVDGVEQSKTNLPLGDYTLQLGKLPAGKHIIALQSYDPEKGLRSPKLYNEILIEEQAQQPKTYIMTTADLTTYKIKNNDSADETDLINTRDGLTKLFADKQAENYQKIVLLKGTYRINGVNARESCISIPSYFTVDMNGSTFKLDTIEEPDDHQISGCIVCMLDVTDAHLENGILEGDRYERKAKNWEINGWGEGINTLFIKAGKYCTVENMTIKNTTGHAVWSLPVIDISQQTKLHGFTNVIIQNGKEVASDKYSTSAMQDLTGLINWDEAEDAMYVGFPAGYRGILTNSSTVYVSFYDADQKFMETITACQFRKILIPENAKYARVTVDETGIVDNPQEQKGVYIYPRHLGEYNQIRNIAFENTRTCALAPTSCNNLLIENVTYYRCGDNITPLPVDFEDGWDECQDVYYRNNVVLERAEGTRGTVVDNAGFNHVYENCVDHQFGINGRLTGCVIRNMDDERNSIKCDLGERKCNSYGRIYNNNCGFINFLRKDKNGVPIPDLSMLSEEEVAQMVNVRVKDCTIKNGTDGNNDHCIGYAEKVTYDNCIFTSFAGRNATFRNCTIQPASYMNNKLFFHGCTFKALDGSESITLNLNAPRDSVREFDKCKFEGQVTIGTENFHNGIFRDCQFENVNFETAVDSSEGEILFEGCTINSAAENLVRTGPYAGNNDRIRITFKDCNITHTGANLIGFFSVPTDDSQILFEDCTINKNSGSLIRWVRNYDLPRLMDKVSVDVKFKNTTVNKALTIDYDVDRVTVDETHCRISYE